ncbi:MAG: NAD(P)-dependent oxidoreductase, partial [Pseudomonadales bacterium]
MNYFPIFVQAEGLKIIVAGAGSFAEAKIRLILKTPAALEVVAASEPTAAISAWAEEGRLVLT